MRSFKNYNIANAKFRELFLPTILMASANNLTVFLNSVVTSRLCGEDRLAAIQIASPLESLLSLIIWTIGIGGSLLCVDRKASGRSQEGDHAFSLSIAALILISAALCVCVTLFKTPLLAALCPDPGIRALTSRYLDIQALTYVPAAYVMGMAYFMRADDRAMLTFISMLTSNVVSLGMDFVFIKGLRMDIRGAALAALAGYTAASAVTTVYFLRGKRTLHFRMRRGSALKVLRDVVMLGFPASAIQLYMLGKNVVVNRIITGMGQKALISLSIFNSSTFIPAALYISIVQTMSPLANAFYLQKDYSSVRHIAKKSMKLLISTTGIIAATVILFPDLLPRLFGFDVSHEGDAVFAALRLLPLSYVGSGVVFTLTFYLQSIKKLKLANLISFLDGFAICTVLILCLPKLFGIWGGWIAVACSPYVTILLYFVYALRGKNGLYLLSPVEESVLFEASVRAAPEEIAGLSEDICLRFKASELSGLAHQIALAVEITAGDIIRKDRDVKNLDVAIRSEDNRILVCIRNTGREYDPKAETEDTDSGNTPRPADNFPDIDCCRVTGVNCTTILIRS